MNYPQIDHTGYPKTLIKKSDFELRAIIKDCREAIEANPDSPKSKGGYYADEINYCVNELNRRAVKRNDKQKAITRKTKTTR